VKGFASSDLSSAALKRVFSILNWFLIENIAFDHHVRSAPGTSLSGVSLGEFPKRYRGTRGLGRGKSPCAQRLTLFGGKMNLFSRSFIRKRVISLVTTASIAATSLALAQNPMRAYHVRGAIPIQYVADRTDYSAEQPFLSENDAAMNKMMADMTVKPTGDVDRDFVAMMVPHHQGAIDMARAELKYGRNELLRRLAQKIIADQKQEITVMRLAVDDERPSSAASPTQPAPGSSPPATSHETMGMSHDDKPHD
jgi:hypothetical protein